MSAEALPVVARPSARDTLRPPSVGWITLSTILNLIDRQTLSILAPTLEKEFGLTNRSYSNIVNAFLLTTTHGAIRKEASTA